MKTAVNWEILGKQSVAGQIIVLGGTRVLRAPHNSECLQVKYDFSPDLPFFPYGIIFSGNNYSSFPDVQVIELNVQKDHIHLVSSIPPKVLISDYTGKLKRKMAIKLFKTYPNLRQKPFLVKRIFCK